MLNRQLYPVSLTLAEVALAAVLLGFLLTFWARFTLGANWSAMVMLKQGHELVHRGPYRRIRHPIYTGVLLAALATAVLNARPLPYVGFVLVLTGFAIKARAEEAILGENLAGYADYRRSSGMFLPR